jgi:hypothetical protein
VYASNLVDPPTTLAFRENPQDLDEANGIMSLTEGVDFPLRELARQIPSGRLVWDVPDSPWYPARFSPDGSWMVAEAFDSEDYDAPTRFAFLDAATGTYAGGIGLPRDVRVDDVVWEDDTHLLFAVREDRQRAILRADLDGTVTRATDLTSGGPYRFSVQP